MSNFLEDLAWRIPALAPLLPSLENALNCILKTYRSGGKLLICGNGGSAADSEHIVGELMKGFLQPRKLTEQEQQQLVSNGCDAELVKSLQKGIRAISLVSGISLPTAYANDVNYLYAFAQQVYNLGDKNDTLMAISTSGNSSNVLYAVQVAKAIGLSVISLTGANLGAIGIISDIQILAPSTITPHIQEFHICIYHALCAELEQRLFGI